MEESTNSYKTLIKPLIKYLKFILQYIIIDRNKQNIQGIKNMKLNCKYTKAFVAQTLEASPKSNLFYHLV